jgi:hypothetical protein
MEPQFKIYGRERRALKKEVGLLKRSLANYWHYWKVNDDMYSCYGHENPESKADAEKYYDSVVAEINEKERLLTVPYEA